MSRYLDSCDELLAVDDYVRYRTWQDELFQVEALQYPAEAIIRNVIPGGRLGTSTVPCRELTRAINNPAEVAPAWFETTYEQPIFDPLPRTMLPCGCHLRRIDFEAVLCPQHLLDVNRPT